MAADENFHNDIIRGLRRRQPAVDILRVQDAGLSGADDATVPAWAAHSSRVMVTHDVAAITKHAYERVRAGQPMPSVFEGSRAVPVRAAIEELLLLADCSLEGEWEGQVRYLPLL